MEVVGVAQPSASRSMSAKPPALYRESAGQPWRDVEIVCAVPYGQFLVREADRLWPGVFVVALSDLRVPGPILELHEPFGNLRRAA